MTHPDAFQRHSGTTGVEEQASDDLSELDLVSQGTFQWSQTPPGEPSGHVHDKQKSQRSPNASRHSKNIEKAPATSPQVFPGQRSSVGDDERTIPHEARGSPRRTTRCTKGNRRPGALNSTPNAQTGQNRLSRRRATRTFVHMTYDATGCTPSPPLVPFRSTTLSSRAITFKGFLTTLTLPREEVVTIRGPIHRAQPPFHLFFLYRESNEPNPASCRGRSKRADPFSRKMPRLSLLSGHSPVALDPSLATPTAASPTLSSCNEARKESPWRVRPCQGTHDHSLGIGAARLLGLSEALGLPYP
ncbi:hypothetical protein CRG98_001988 [Punica granatum]|uniref:Uncharacterized protein n=1 Tax=Punica granatum TaxID=22663 RepID=A0A2I0LAG4_PUNGR|nr:hypothetical protein CRG98_001988 [Punica granatum]